MFCNFLIGAVDTFRDQPGRNDSQDDRHRHGQNTEDCPTGKVGLGLKIFLMRLVDFVEYIFLDTGIDQFGDGIDFLEQLFVFGDAFLLFDL